MPSSKYALWFSFGVLCAINLCVCQRAAAADSDSIGTSIADFSLKNQFGKEYSLADAKDAQVVVVAFVGTECPLAKLYAPRLAQLATTFDSSKVAFLAIDSNQQDSIEEIAAYASRHGIEFPILKDAGNQVADLFSAERTPEVFVLDKDRRVRYHGRVDDQYGFTDGVGYQRPDPTRNDLAEAIGELLAGHEVKVPATSIVGCKIGRVREPDADAKVTYSKEIARIFQNHCVECHREGRIGPFTMNSYDEVVGWGEMIGEVVEQQRMPPWHANKQHGTFSNDLSLSDEDRNLIAQWVESGCPEGDPADLPAPREFSEGWAIGQPDEIFYMNDTPIDVPAEGVIDYEYFVVDPGWKEDKWIMAAEAKPGSLETVHHILVFVTPPDSDDGMPHSGRLKRNRKNAHAENKDAAIASTENENAKPDNGKQGQRDRGQRGRSGDRRGGGGGGVGNGNLIAGYAPGANPMIATDGKTAMLVKAGSKLIFQMHYTPNGTPHTDLSCVAFKYADPDKIEYVTRSTSVLTTFFAIPPGERNYEVSSEGTFENDTLVDSLTPHMHTRGKSFRYEVVYPTGDREILLDVPRYDFNWQTTYKFDEPKLLPKGSKLVCTARWDNSEDNLSNPDPTKTVTWGDQTFEEMMIGFYFEVFPKGQMPKRPSGGFGLSDLSPEKVLKMLDANKDGGVSLEESPSMIAERFQMIDRDGDGKISPLELKTLLALFGSFGARD